MTEHILFIALVFLVLLSAFFSGSETGMMAINRYRLRHLARKEHRAASRTNKLLQRPDRLLGVILLGNTFANILASAIATMLAIRFFGDVGVLLASVILTIIVLIFAEVMPKTVAAQHPENVAFPASLPLKILLIIFYPLVWLLNTIANGILKLFRIRIKKKQVLESLSREELRTLLHEAGDKISPDHQAMLLGILDLEKVTVDDIMVPRSEIAGIDINNKWDDVVKSILASKKTRVLVYRNSIDNVVGMLYLPEALSLLAQHHLTKSKLISVAQDVYFIPEGTELSVQLLNFQQAKVHIGLVVDEYGDIQGLVSLVDVLEEIVGEYESDLSLAQGKISQQKDGSYLVAGHLNVRDINRKTGWHLPVEGPNTLSGLIIEYFEAIPSKGLAMRIAGYPIEVIEVDGTTIKQARIWPELHSEAK